MIIQCNRTGAVNQGHPSALRVSLQAGSREGFMKESGAPEMRLIDVQDCDGGWGEVCSGGCLKWKGQQSVRSIRRQCRNCKEVPAIQLTNWDLRV